MRLNLLVKTSDKYFAEVSSGVTRRNSDIARRIVQLRSELNYDTILGILNMRDDVEREFLIERCERVQTKNFWLGQAAFGSWDGETTKFDPDVHAPGIHATPTEDFRKALLTVGFEVLGVKEVVAIGTVTNGKNGKRDNTGVRGEYLILEGERLRVFPENDDTLGVYFVNAVGERFRSTERLMDNDPKRVVPKVPANIAPGEYDVEIVTRYSAGKYALKEPRTIVYKSKLTIS